MPRPQQYKHKGRGSGGQRVAPESKGDDTCGAAPAAGPSSPQHIEENEPKTPSRTEDRGKYKATAYRYDTGESHGDEYEEDAVGSGITMSVTSPLVNNPEEGVPITRYHLDDDEIWKAIWLTTYQPGAKGMLADEIHRKWSDMHDYQFLLEAVRCEALRKRDLRDTCIRLYLLIKSCIPLSPGSDDEYSKAQFDRQFEEYFNMTGGEVDQLIGQLQRMTVDQTLEEQGDERAFSVSQPSYYASHQTPAAGKGISKMTRRQSSNEASKIRSPVQTSKNEMERGYRIKTSKFFTVGRVFTMLWHDNATAAKRHVNDTGTMTPGPYGQLIYSQIRRFAVVKEGHGCSWAIPINTYHEQATTRTSLSSEDIQAHAIIHMKGTEPKLLAKELALIKSPIMVDAAGEDRKLHPASRIRFDKVFTIEHNVMVKNVGKISPESMAHFIHYWNEQAVGVVEPEAV